MASSDKTRKEAQALGRLPLHPSVKLSPEEVNLLMKIVEPLRYAQNTLTLSLGSNVEKEWSEESENAGPISSIDSALYILHSYRSEVTAGQVPSDDTAATSLPYLRKFCGWQRSREGELRLIAVTKGQEGILQKLVKNANAEKLIIIEARLITEITQLIPKFMKHLDSLPMHFADCPGMFPSENTIEHYKRSIFDPIRWKEGHTNLQYRFSSLAGAYTYLREGHDCPRLIGRLDFMRVQSIFLSGVTQLNGMTQHDLGKYNFVFDNPVREDEFENLLFLLAKPIIQWGGGREKLSPVDVTTTVVRIKNCFAHPHEVLTPAEFNSFGPVVVPDEHMRVGIRVQWHVFGFGEYNSDQWWSSRPLHLGLNWSKDMAGRVRLLDEIWHPTDIDSVDVLRQILHPDRQSKFASGVKFSPSLLLYSML